MVKVRGLTTEIRDQGSEKEGGLRFVVSHSSTIKLWMNGAQMVNAPDEYSFGTAYFKKKKYAGAKAQALLGAADGTAEAVS